MALQAPAFPRLAAHAAQPCDSTGDAQTVRRAPGLATRGSAAGALLERSLGAAVLLVGACRGRRAARRAARRVARRAGAGGRAEEFGGIELHGPLAAWIAEQRGACRGGFEPTPIQARGVRPVREGQSVALMAPTGTGKTLAYLLPLWERLVAAAPPGQPGPCLLVVAPSEDLQVQIGRELAALVGEQADASVVVLRRSLGGMAERLPAARAVVATPTLLLEQFEMPQLGAAWREAAVVLRALVIDEADCMVPPGGAKNSNLGLVLDFLRGAREEGQAAAGEPYRPPQLVLASASIDAWTLGLLEDSVGALLVPVRVDPAAGPGAAVAAAPGAGAGGERPWLWPQGLRHMVMPTEQLFHKKGAVSRHAVDSVAQAVASLDPRRCLVVFAERRAVAERGASLGKYLNEFRKQLRPLGYVVTTVSAAVEAGGAGGSGPQVLVGRSEAIRGVDLPGVDLVVVVGEFNTSREYMHIAGRTARWEPGQGAPQGGTVVSIVSRRMVSTLRRWGKELGFRLDQVRLRPLVAAT